MVCTPLRITSWLEPNGFLLIMHHENQLEAMAHVVALLLLVAGSEMLSSRYLDSNMPTIY